MLKVMEPAKLGHLELRNRFVRSATWDGTAEDSGVITDASVKINEDVAAGGVGLIIAGYAFVHPRGHSIPGQYGVHSDAMIPGLRRITEAIHKHGAKTILQIAHGGGRSYYHIVTGQVALTPSLYPSQFKAPQPQEVMTDAHIEEIIDAFAAAAVRTREAGFDGLQIHSAHGYLGTQFFSPLINKRQDKWGGSPENRRRFHVEVIRRMRAAVGPDYHIQIKFGIEDEEPGGATLDEGIAAVKAMSEAGLDAVEVSWGVGRSASMKVIDGQICEFIAHRESAKWAKRELNIPVELVSGVRTIETAEDIITSGDADFVSMCRPFIREPGILNRWMKGDLRKSLCTSCHLCHDATRDGDFFDCHEPKESYEESAGV